MVYEISWSQDRIKELARFLVINHKDEFHNFIILMESGLACKSLQDEIISYLSELSISTSFLPEILPIFKDDTKVIKYFNNVIDDNEAELILSKLLLEKKLSNNFSNILPLSKQLLNLYKEFAYHNISINKLEIFYSTNLSEQSYKNIDIVKKVFLAYDDYKAKLGKIDITSFQKEILLSKTYYKNKKIVVGFIEQDNFLIKDFIKNIVNNGGMYFPKKYPEDILSSTSKIDNNIKIAELENEFDEAQHIANLCKTNSNSNILILSENSLFNELLEINLKKYDLQYANYLCKNKTDEFLNLFLKLVIFLYEKFDLKKLILILKSPLLINQNIYEIEYKVFRQKNHIQSVELLLQNINNLCSEENIIWFKNFYKVLEIFDKDSNISHIEIAKKLAVFCKVNINEYEDYLQLIENFNKYFNVINKDQYLNYLIYITQNYFIQTKNKDSNIIISKVADSYLFSNIDLVIIPSFLDSCWPKNVKENLLLNKFMLEKLGISKSTDENSLMILTEIVKKNNLYVTYPKKFGCESVNKSKYLGIFDSIFSQNSSGLLEFEKPIYVKVKYNNEANKTNKETIIFDSSLMPDKISATNIEMLIRNPYGFYAKNVLKLIPLKPLIPEMKLSEFGSFIHLILDKYSKNYDITEKDRLQNLINLSKSTYQDISNNCQLSISWLYKFEKIAKNFIEFDELRRQNLKDILSEIHGYIEIPIGKRIIKITAIADRIEVTKNNEIYILDYKTGTVPSIKSVIQGITPQLVLEGLIAKHGGFLALNSTNIKKLLYVKISITEPYFTTTEIEINDEFLEKHFEGLKKLLNHYYNTDNVKIKKSELDISFEYNDYKHIMRENVIYTSKT